MSEREDVLAAVKELRETVVAMWEYVKETHNLTTDEMHMVVALRHHDVESRDNLEEIIEFWNKCSEHGDHDEIAEKLEVFEEIKQMMRRV